MPRDRDDNAAYMREWRKTTEGRASLRAQKQKERARQAAYRALAEMYPDKFAELYRHALRTVRLTADN